MDKILNTHNTSGRAPIRRSARSGAAVLTIALAILLAGCGDSRVNTRGVPRDSVGFAFLDFKAAKKSTVLEAIEKRINSYLASPEKEAAEFSREYENFKVKTGFNPQTDIESITVSGKILDKDSHLTLVIVRGNYSPEKALAFLNTEGEFEKGSKAFKEGNYTFYQNGNVAFCFAPNTFIFLGAVEGWERRDRRERDLRIYAKEIVAALEDKSKSYKVPDSPFLTEELSKNPILAAYADTESPFLKMALATGALEAQRELGIPLIDPSLPVHVTAVLGEKDNVLSAKIRFGGGVKGATVTYSAELPADYATKVVSAFAELLPRKKKPAPYSRPSPRAVSPSK
ncbi:MAG: hypothetical protein LBT53_06105 [Puniceicoccales bacterium]|jgi:hypothetical protein|nr:hypothetical protein [Puniceicoccales bacterium]